MLLWVLLWVVLVLGGGLALGLLGRGLWQKVKALTAEVGEASERLTAVLSALNDVAQPAGQPATHDRSHHDDNSDRRGRRH